jgi:DNA excision repair protein ERCC-1
MSQQEATTSTSSVAVKPLNMNANTKANTTIHNPYAKKPSSLAASVAPLPVGNPYARVVAREDTQQQPPPTKRPSPPPVNEFTTFSQAFGNEDPDANFGEEDRAQQFVFDQEISSHNSSNTNNDTNLGNNLGITPRDHQTYLQPHTLHISTRQRGNPIIEHIRNVPFKYSTMVPDYIMSPTRCALFLSLRYHNLHPNYIHRRIAELRSDFEYRMLLCHVDLEDNATPILFLNDTCVQNNLTLILAWSEEEAARYLETVKAFDGKDPNTVIGKHEPKTHIEKVVHALCSVPSVNKTDASQLLNQFGTFQRLATASVDEIGVCPGIGPKKVRRLFEAFHRPFSEESVKRRKERDKVELEEGQEDQVKTSIDLKDDAKEDT